MYAVQYLTVIFAPISHDVAFNACYHEATILHMYAKLCTTKKIRYVTLGWVKVDGHRGFHEDHLITCQNFLHCLPCES